MEDKSMEATTHIKHFLATEAEKGTQQQTQPVDPVPTTAAYGRERRREGQVGDRVTCLARAGTGRVLHQFVTLYRGWRTYVSYSVALAGLALAFLYMTVLDFHNITVGELVFHLRIPYDIRICVTTSLLVSWSST